MSETRLHRCALCGEIVAPESARLLPTCGGHVARDSERWNTPFRIRAERPEDTDVIRRIAQGYWGHDEVFAFGRLYPILEQQTLVADAGGAVAGFAACRTEDTTGYVLALAVPPLYQGLGVGSSLLSSAVHELAKAGAEVIRLSTTNDNLPALSLYQRRGFTVEEVLPGEIARFLEERLGRIPAGFAGIPVRDEIRLRRPLNGDSARDAV